MNGADHGVYILFTVRAESAFDGAFNAICRGVGFCADGIRPDQRQESRGQPVFVACHCILPLPVARFRGPNPLWGAPRNRLFDAICSELRARPELHQAAWWWHQAVSLLFQFLLSVSRCFRGAGASFPFAWRRNPLEAGMNSEFAEGAIS